MKAEDETLIAAEIDELTDELGEWLKTHGKHRTAQAVAMALAKVSAEIILHDDGDQEDVVRIAKAAARRVWQMHRPQTH